VFTSLGTGVRDFFKHPAEGAVLSPADFAMGVGASPTRVLWARLCHYLSAPGLCVAWPSARDGTLERTSRRIAVEYCYRMLRAACCCVAGKGTVSIVSGVVGAGALAGSSITSSVASGLSLLTFDSEYIADRQARRKKVPKTLLRGLAAGTVGLGRGIFEGYVGKGPEPWCGFRVWSGRRPAVLMLASPCAVVAVVVCVIGGGGVIAW
jgi:hypothetical protein